MSELPIVVGIDEQDAHPIEIDRWVALASSVLVDEGVLGPAELDLTFVDAHHMRSLNEEHMGESGGTDVLSFPIDDRTDAVLEGQPRLLGDVVICPEIVYERAPGSPIEELALMVVHGVLHILGMDHAEALEAAEMRAAEQRHLQRWRESA